MSREPVVFELPSGVWRSRPDDEILAKMHEIAKRLGARVAGDENETL